MTHFQAGTEILADNIPEALRTDKRHVGWRYEERRGQAKPAKMPYSPIMEDPREGASSTNPAHWTTFKNALEYARVAGLDGVMRAFDPSDGLVGIDFDNCRDPETGELTERVAELVRRLDTYCEVSPSGAGVKLWAYGTLPPFGRHKGDVEMYCSGRFFTMTGQHVEGTPHDVCYRPDAILAIHREVFGAAPDLTAAADDPERAVPALQLGDEDVIRLAAESAHNGERFRRLWSGDTSDYAVDGNDGTSEADGALCELLAYYGGPDRERIERLWLRSELGTREKVQRADYRKRTIDLALRGKTRFYGDSVPPAVPIGSDGASGCACDTCPAAARVTFLERRLLDHSDEIESLRTCNGTLSRKLTDALERLDGWKSILSNPKLKPADRIVAIPFVEHVREARRNGQDEIHVRYPGIVNGWGIPESTVQKSADVLTEMEGAVLSKRNEPDKPVVVDTKRGPREVTPWKTIVQATVGGDLYAAVGAYDPGLPQRGGKRDPLPQCKDHPTDDLVVRSVTQCAKCRKPLESKERGIRRQNEGVKITPDTTVVVSSLRLQNEVVGGHDGEDQPERAANDTASAGEWIARRDPTLPRVDLDVTGACPSCGPNRVLRGRSGVWTCASCGEVAHTESWAAKPSPDGRLPGFDPPPIAPAIEPPGVFR